MIKALIVDDTRLARQELKFLLVNYPIIEVVGEAINAIDAREKIKTLQPDLLFLDIQMPGQNGFELLTSLDVTPDVVFTTAYDQYALKAFEYNALDYLQKPITDTRLRQVIQKLENKFRVSTTPSNTLLTPDKQVFVKDGNRCWFVKLADIRLFEVVDNYTRVYFQKESPLVPKSLNYLESRLNPRTFFRANRQQIINTQWIDKVEPWFSGTIKIYLKDGTPIEVSRRQTSKFKQLMSF